MNIRKNKDKKFTDIINKLEIDETFTKLKNKQRKFNKFIDGIVPEEHFNYMADLIELPLTDKKFKYLLVVLDLATNLFDIEPLKNKESQTTLDGLKAIFKRKILILPEISLKTDDGKEFKASFNKFLKENDIFHKVSYPYRKNQMSPVESLNNSIGRILMNYLNKITIQLDNGEDYTNWTDILPQLRKQLNEYRERDLNKLKQYQSKQFHNPLIAKPKFNVGDFVHYKLNKPQNIRGLDVPDATRFRNGDRRYSIDAREIISIIEYPNPPYHRYKLHDLNNISFSHYELLKSEKDDNFLEVKKIIGRRVINKRIHYLVWFKGELKKQALWLLKDELIKDGLEQELKDYDKESKKKKKKR